MIRRRSFLGYFVPPDPGITRIQALLIRWEHTCRKHLAIAPRVLPWLILYDQEHAWHVNAEDGVLNGPKRRVGVVVWAGRKLRVYKVRNSLAGVWLPDGETVAAELGGAVKPWPKNGRKDSATFVQMPLPSLFRSRSENGISDNHWQSLALHELTHTLHFLTVVRQWRALQEKYEMPQVADDDMIESAFRGNAEYVSLYGREKQLLQKAVFTENLSVARQAAKESLLLARERRRRFFKPGWAEAEALWLSLEGCALWVQVRFEIENAPAGQSWQETARGLAGFMEPWSQEHGAGLFWIMDKLVPDWKPRYFGGDPLPSPFDVLEQVL
jgi:hypothetical protein